MRNELTDYIKELKTTYNISDEDIDELELFCRNALDNREDDIKDDIKIELLEQIPKLINNIRTEYPFKNDDYVNGYIDGIETLETIIEEII